MVAGGRRILVVEDDVLEAEALVALLELQGHTVSRAETGRLGLEAAIGERLDIVIVDLGLPDLSGCDLIRALRASDRGAEVIILAYSGWHLLEWPAYDAGCDAFVLKPAVDELGELIRRASDVGLGFASAIRRHAHAR